MSSTNFSDRDNFESLADSEDYWLSDESASPPEAVGEAMPEEELPKLAAINSYDEAEPALNWYVVHTFSGYENKVKANIERIVENRRLHDVILEVAVPVQETIEIVKGREKKIQHKIYPGYVFLHMKMNGDTWYIIRNTRGVTGFVGPESKYVPLSEAEVQKMGLGVHDSVETSKVARLAEGDVVRILGGPFDQSIGTIQEVNALKGTATVDLAVFGRITTLELDLSKITKEVVKS